MKTLPFTTISAGAAVFLGAAAYAIEAPADNAPPPALAEALPADEGFKPQAMKETAYLGVVSAPIPEVLAAHLSIKADEGVVVRAVMPDGPASKSGIAVHDVITRVAGQAVGSPEELSRQIGGHKPGDSVHFNLIHAGKATEAHVTLGVRPHEIAAAAAHPLDHLKLEGVPEELAERLRGMIQGNLGALEMHLGEAEPQINEAMREMKQRIENARQQMEQAVKGLDVPEFNKGDAENKIDVQQGATIRMLDGQGSIELKSNNGGKEVTLRDKENNITWTGPWDTAQDKAAAPDDVRQRVERLNIDTDFQGNGLRLRMQPDQAPDPGGQ